MALFYNGPIPPFSLADLEAIGFGQRTWASFGVSSHERRIGHETIKKVFHSFRRSALAAPVAWKAFDFLIPATVEATGVPSHLFDDAGEELRCFVPYQSLPRCAALRDAVHAAMGIATLHAESGAAAFVMLAEILQCLFSVGGSGWVWWKHAELVTIPTRAFDLWCALTRTPRVRPPSVLTPREIYEPYLQNADYQTHICLWKRRVAMELPFARVADCWLVR